MLICVEEEQTKENMDYSSNRIFACNLKMDAKSF